MTSLETIFPPSVRVFLVIIPDDKVYPKKASFANFYFKYRVERGIPQFQNVLPPREEFLYTISAPLISSFNLTNLDILFFSFVNSNNLEGVLSDKLIEKIITIPDL